MRFKLVKTGKSYRETQQNTLVAEAEVELKTIVPPIIWETSNTAQIRSLLVLQECELVVAKTQLTGNDYTDWYTKNRILDLEIKIADLRKWLTEAMEKKDGH